MNVRDIMREYRITSAEIRRYIIVILCLSFVFSFDQWGTDTFNVGAGIGNWILTAVIALIAVLLHDAGHRLVAMYRNEQITYHLSRNALLWSLLLVFLSNGKLTLLLGGYIEAKQIRGGRHGQYPRFIGPGSQWPNMLAGPFLNILAGGIAHFLAQNGIAAWFFAPFAAFNVIYALSHLIPIPPFDGFYLFLYSRAFFAGVALGVVSYVMMILSGIAASLFLAILIGFLGVFFWWWFVERK